MSSALKACLLPALKACGFSGSYPRYRRLVGNKIELLAIFFDKADTSFFIELGSHPKGVLQTSWGDVVAEDKLLLEHVMFTERARLQASCSGGSGPHQWFRFGAFGDQVSLYDGLAERVTAMLPQIEAWFDSGSVDANISPCGPQLDA